MYCGHARLCVCACLSVCLSAAVRPHYYTDPDVTWRHGRGCPYALLGGFAIGARLRCYGNRTRTQLQACVHPAIWRHSANGRLGGGCARWWPLTGGWRGAFSKLRAVYGKWAWLARRWLAVDGGHSQHYCGSLDWWRSGNIMRTQNVSEYMLVLALCLVCCCFGAVYIT